MMIPFEPMIFDSMKIPALRWTSYLPDPVLSIVGQMPLETSTIKPSSHFSNSLIHKLGPSHIFNRFVHHMFSNVVHFMFLQVFYPESRLGDYSYHFSNSIIGDGITGYREMK